MFYWLHKLSRSRQKENTLFARFNEGSLPPSQDTFAAIDELSRVVRNNPDAVEIYLALGNLFRSQGEIERAIQIRTNLIARPQLNEQFKARAWFELGIDYKRAGIHDRAHSALKQASSLTGDDPAILTELARLYAEISDFRMAARYYSLLGQPLPQAHYLIQEARRQAGNNQGQATKLINKAIKVYPGSVEAWLEIICRDHYHGRWSDMKADLQKALTSVEPRLRFVLLEGLYQQIRQINSTEDQDFIEKKCAGVIVETMKNFEQDLILSYYCSVFLKESGQPDQAREWLEKALVMDQEFWPARLEILDLTRHEQILTESFKTQLVFFTTKARMVKRFICSVCGLKRERIFFLCPRCFSWHSISFRTLLNE